MLIHFLARRAGLPSVERLVGWIALLVVGLMAGQGFAQTPEGPKGSSVLTPPGQTAVLVYGGSDASPPYQSHWVSPALKQLRESGEFSTLVEKHLTEARADRTLGDWAQVAITVVALLALVFAVVLSWNRSLRAQVEIRTAQIAEAAAEKDQLAKTLAEREQRLRVAVGQMPAVLWSTDRDLRLTSAAGLGLPTETAEANRLIGTPARIILEDLSLDPSTVLPRLNLGLQGQASDLLIRVWGKDVELHIEPLRDSNGEVSGLVGIALDISERTRAEQALRESDERYRAFLEHSTEGIWRWEFKNPWPKDKSVDEQLDHFLTYAYVAECNDAMARLYELSRADDLVGRTYAEVRKLRTTPTTIDHTRDFIASGARSAHWEAEWVDRHGGARWSATTVVGIIEDGALVRTWATQQDITQRKRAEEDLRRALSLVRATLESTADGLLVEDAAGAIVDANEQFARMWGLPADQMAPKTRTGRAIAVEVTRQLQDQSGFMPRISQIHSRPELDTCDVLRLTDGRVFERHSRPQRLGDAVVGRVWSFRDITERERSLRAIQEANRLLELKNAELERFTYTVSHDLRSPLITIRGYLGHLEKSALDGDFTRFRDDAARITRATNKMEELLRDLLELSRVGRILKPDQNVPMQAVVQDAVDLLHGILTERGVEVEIEPGLTVVRGDRQRLAEVVQNLIENAAKFTTGRPHPRIRIGARVDPEATVFFVNDNGIGIDPRHRDKVFDLFEKLTPGTEGTGVGLALVKRIVEAHGGRVWVESEGSNLGSTFCFTLRMASRLESTV